MIPNTKNVVKTLTFLNVIFIFRRGLLLCKDSNSSDWVYIVKTGTCRVLKALYTTKPQVPGVVLRKSRDKAFLSKYSERQALAGEYKFSVARYLHPDVSVWPCIQTKYVEPFICVSKF